MIYSCGEVTSIYIDSTTIEYGSGAWETIDASYLQYAHPWEPFDE